LDELFEAVTWAQLGIHAKPIGLLNVQGYFDFLLRFADRVALDGFVRTKHRDLLVVASDPAALLGDLEAFEAPPASKFA
jgi:predicted Rossmann-fold nucleotide-binding protein